MTSMLFESVSEYEVSDGSGGLRNTRITQRRHNSLSCLGQFGPYVQQLMILTLKSTRNMGGYNIVYRK
jgi:hypothetical protein